jgi:hypothetical protein
MLRIRQIVFAARDLAHSVAQFEQALGLQVAYRDPLVAEFGLHNALLPIGDQFLEVVSPIRSDTAAGRHLERHGDSAYMLILQTDDIEGDRARLSRLGVRVVWQADHPDIRASHLHPKDIGAAIVSLDQPVPPESWRWAGPHWRPEATAGDAPRIIEATIGAVDPDALARRWAEVLGTAAPRDHRILIQQGALCFARAATDRIIGYRLSMPSLGSRAEALTLCGTQFRLA